MDRFKVNTYHTSSYPRDVIHWPEQVHSAQILLLNSKVRVLINITTAKTRRLQIYPDSVRVHRPRAEEYAAVQWMINKGGWLESLVLQKYFLIPFQTGSRHGSSGYL